MTSNTIAQLYNGDLYTLDGIEYEPQTGFYFILHRHESSAGVVEHAVTTFKMWSPVSVESSYQTAYNTSSIWLPTSMCMDGYVYYTVMGHDSFTGENIFWRSSAGSFSEGCDRIVKCIAKDMPPVPDKYYYRNAIPTLWKVLIFDKLDVSSVIVYPCEKICH